MTRTGGGAATHSGADYQNRVAAWTSVRILAERQSTPPCELPAFATLEFLRCETLEPVDDLLIGISTSGHIFLQAKHSIALGSTDNSEFAEVIDQFVSQFFAHPAATQQPSWHRPLDKTLDRLVLATSSRSSSPIRHVLPGILNRLRALGPNQSIDAAANSGEERKTLMVLKDHVMRAWRALKGTDPTTAGICEVASLMWVQMLDVDAGGAQEREAKDLLRQSVLRNPSDTDLAWNKLISICATLATSRTGATRPGLQQSLIEAGIDILAAPSYRSDIDKLKAVSANGLRSLSSLSDIRISGTKTVKLSRAATAELQKAAAAGSLVVVGQPGAGKSGGLHDLARLLEPVGDVLVFVVDQFDAGSLGFLRSELGCSHEIADILRNWPGTRPGFLVIDALDAARTESGAKAFRELIGSTLADGSRWRVIPSIRKFDLRYSAELKALFPGTPPSQFQDGEFKTIRHLEIPILSDAELQEVSRQSRELGGVINAASAQLKELLRIPFNLRLIAEMIRTGATVDSVSPIRTQLELLEGYWQARVVGSDTQGDAREAVLRKATIEMVARRSLRIDRSIVAADPAASTPLNQVMSAQILVEWRPSPENSPERYVLTYCHHILFDYAVSRLLLRGPLDHIMQSLEKEPDLFLAIRPSLALHFHYLWNLDLNHRRFWECVFVFLESNKLPSTGKILGPLIMSQLVESVADCQMLLDSLKDENSPHHMAARAAFQHAVGAAHSSSGSRPLVGASAAPWPDILKEVARI